VKNPIVIAPRTKFLAPKHANGPNEKWQPSKRGARTTLDGGAKSASAGAGPRCPDAALRPAAAALPPLQGLQWRTQGAVVCVPGMRSRRLFMLRLVAHVLVVLAAVLRRLLVRSVVVMTLLVVAALLLGRAGVNHGRT